MTGLKEMGEMPVVAVNVAEAASIRNTYLNLRAELWFTMRDWLMRRDCRLPEDEHLYAELIAPQFDYNSPAARCGSRLKRKCRGAKSPDRADALALTFASAGAVFNGTAGKGWTSELQSRVKRFI